LPPAIANSSINIGFPLTDQLRTVFHFLDDPTIPQTLMVETCERCPVPDCNVRAAEPVEMIRQQQMQ